MKKKFIISRMQEVDARITSLGVYVGKLEDRIVTLEIDAIVVPLRKPPIPKLTIGRTKAVRKIHKELSK